MTKQQKIRTNLLVLYGISIFLVACSPTRYIAKDEYVVDKVKITCDDNSIKTGKLKNVVQPRPLKKFLKFYSLRARIYNIPNPKKDEKRENRKQNKLDKINQRRDKRFDKETARLQKKYNRSVNKTKRLKKEGDKQAYEKAKHDTQVLNDRLTKRRMNSAERKDANRKKDVFRFYEFFRKIGQKPEVYDTMLVNYSKRQINVYMKNQGYFNCQVTDTVKYPKLRRKRAIVYYKIKAGEPLKITTVKYSFPDSVPEMREFFDKENNKFKAGKKFDVSKMEEYRVELANKYRNNGFYYFSKQLISYKIDTIGRYQNAILYINFNNRVDKKIYQKWRIRNINIYNDYAPMVALQHPDLFFNYLQPVEMPENTHKNYQILKKEERIIKPKFLLNEIYLLPDSLYRLDNTKNTYSHLSKFKIYKLINIQFQEVPDSSNSLDCEIMLAPGEKRGVVFDLESTNTSVNVGFSGNAMFSHKNLFHGGEILDTRFQLVLEREKVQDSTENFFTLNTQEYLFDFKITFPRILLPKGLRTVLKNFSFIEQNNPRTIFSTLFSYQRRPEYNKIQIIFNNDFFMRSSDFSSHTITPIRISSIRVPVMSYDFLLWIHRTLLQESYEDHFIIGSKYSYTYSDQGTKGNNIFLRTNVAWSGNILYGLRKVFKFDTVGGSYILPVVNTPFAQFFKTDVDFRYYHKPDNEQQFIGRIFVGVAVPYGNRNLLPFSEKYFVGGANSIRAWQARALGPGNYKQPDSLIYSNQTGDVKLELNLEYRFNIIKFLEGAFFVDAGNIWAINSYNSPEESIFFFKDFYKQMGVGTGFGTRLNLNFFILRVDLGVKIIDPALPAGQRIMPMTHDYKLKDFTVNIAIGYPF